MVKPRKVAKRPAVELDSTYALKLVLYLIVGTLWVRVQTADGSLQVPLPLGLVIGILFAMHEHFQIDRKVEYAVLLVAMLVGFWTQAGVLVTL